jgi:fructose-1,6-bisphosphatase/inositol monophosphatase family enzyme
VLGEGSGRTGLEGNGRIWLVDPLCGTLNYAVRNLLVALCQAAGCLVTGIDGQPLHTGAEGLVVAADEQTHAALLALIRNQRAKA